MICKHPAWDLDDDGTLYCTSCDIDLIRNGKYKTLLLDDFHGYHSELED